MASPLAMGKGPTIIAVSLIFLVIAYIAVCLRFWSRHVLKRKFFAHDVLILCGLVCATGLVALLIITVQYGGLGQHGTDLIVQPDYAKKLVVFGKSLLAVSPLWAAAMTCIRLSILNLYMHLFSMHPRFRIACYCVMAFATAWFPTDFLTAFLICRPFAFTWNPLLPGGHCGNTGAAYVSMHALNVAIDISIALLPAPVLWGLQMRTARKLGIMFMFSLGALICAISVARIALYKQLDLHGIEFTYDASILYLFTVMEPLLAISLACMPLLRPAGEKIANSSALSWVKSIHSSITSSRGESKYSTDKGKHTSLDEYPLQSREPNAQYGRLSGSSKNIHVTSEVEQIYEAKSQRSVEV